MVDAAPFAALRYDPQVAGPPVATSAPGYDELEPLTYAQHRTASPYTVLELLAPAGTVASYRAAGDTLRRWLRTGVLVRDDEPALYLYEEHELRHGVPAVQRGVLAAVAVSDPQVLAHESVDQARVAGRTERLRQVPLDPAPVFAVYPSAPPALRTLLRSPPAAPPLVALSDEAGVDHRVWRLDAPTSQRVRDALRDVSVVVADGHHRLAAAQALAGAGGDGRTLMYLVDAAVHGPQILPVHRLLRGAAGALPEVFDGFVRWRAAPGDAAGLWRAVCEEPGRAWGLRLPGGSAFLLTPADESALQAPLARRSAAWRALDAAIFSEVLLPRLPDVAVAYRADLPAAVTEVDTSTADALVVFRPVSIDDVYACALAGEPMPPKTTWFRPKPRTGMVMRSLDF